jgi:hypothetical protein
MHSTNRCSAACGGHIGALFQNEYKHSGDDTIRHAKKSATNSSCTAAVSAAGAPNFFRNQARCRKGVEPCAPPAGESQPRQELRGAGGEAPRTSAKWTHIMYGPPMLK